ncbi:hypothetical protein FNL39_103526 [Nocardia caishijiensis]|uniref:DUF3039 domain-containing protein n=2 Tax=Nocardia caishijiensis TaxID=184756 RepID=A0ABQ6YQ34_9NOCA|nr:hypothetical protein FNL39_103526 [Nocardia caishijiensis]
MEGMSTDTLVRPETTTDETTGDDVPKFFHYVKKDRIAESAVMGTMVVALCGEVFPVTRSPKPGSPVCPDCKKVYDRLRKGGD